MNYDVRIDVQEPAEVSVPGVPEAQTAHGADGPEAGDLPGPLWRRPLFLAALALVALMAAIVIAIRLLAPASQGADADANQIPVVSVVNPGRSTVAGVINATGTLAARREMPVGSVGEGGQVRSVLVEAGDWVEKGQVLAVIDRSVQSQQIASQAAQVRVSQADARLAQSNLDRALKLVDRGFISRADVDRLTAERDAANARVSVAQATLGQLQAQAARLNILAPEAGLVLARNVEPGQVVTSGSGVLFRMAKGGEMELRADLGEDDLSRIAVGNIADVSPVGIDKHFAGEIWQIAPVVDTQSRQGQARIALAYAPELRPGGFASATLRSGTVVAPVLPESAIQSDARGSFVFVVGKDERVQRRAVKTGQVSEHGIAVVEGLDGTERVVLRAGGFLNPGDKVRVRRVSAGS